MINVSGTLETGSIRFHRLSSEGLSLLVRRATESLYQLQGIYVPIRPISCEQAFLIVRKGGLLLERLREFLIRNKNLSEEEADLRIKESRELIASGKCPEEVLVEMYGTDVEDLIDILGGQLS